MNPFIYSTIIISICILMQTSAFGQEAESEIYSSHKYAVKFSPLSLIPLPLSSLQFGFEHKLKNERHAFQHEIGAIFSFPYRFFNDDSQEMVGFRAISGYRYYINEPNSRFNFFTSVQYRSQYESWGLRHWFGSPGSIGQQFDYKKRVMSHGLLASFGGNKKAKYSNFLFEWEIGFGAKSRTVFNKGVPSDATINNNSFVPILGNQFNPTEAQTAGTRILPVILGSIKLGFVIP